MAVERRQLFRILGATLATGSAASGQKAHVHDGPAKKGSPYAPRALSQKEYEVVDRIADIILPTDETSPGAHDAGVARYMDIVLLYGDKATLASWQSGVKQTDASAQQAHGRQFSELAREQQEAVVRQMAANETNPTTELEKFFIAVKRLAIEAFYLSAAGKQSLGYKGDKAISAFIGCAGHNHPERA